MLGEFVGANPQVATMGKTGETQDKVNRDTAVVFAPFDHWLSTHFSELANIANETCEWKYFVTQREAIQFATYGVGQHYNWHTDTFTLSGKEYDRKITVVCLLNDPTEFEGGEFELRLYNEYKAPLKKGSVIAFPSILEHRVTPVTKGVRYSATMWLSGPRFR
jgi:PKHD-type hydroxylase